MLDEGIASSGADLVGGIKFRAVLQFRGYRYGLVTEHR
jgi:hypothetical protein